MREGLKVQIKLLSLAKQHPGHPVSLVAYHQLHGVQTKVDNPELAMRAQSGKMTRNDRRVTAGSTRGVKAAGLGPAAPPFASPCAARALWLLPAFQVSCFLSKYRPATPPRAR